ncbi:hypothetical protein VPH35_062105 [Triticum aestivum]
MEQEARRATSPKSRVQSPCDKKQSSPWAAQRIPGGAGGRRTDRVPPYDISDFGAPTPYPRTNQPTHPTPTPTHSFPSSHPLPPPPPPPSPSHSRRAALPIRPLPPLRPVSASLLAPPGRLITPHYRNCTGLDLI